MMISLKKIYGLLKSSDLGDCLLAARLLKDKKPELFKFEEHESPEHYTVPPNLAHLLVHRSGLETWDLRMQLFREIRNILIDESK